MCYTVPVAAAAITSFICRGKRSIRLWWLNLMFMGGALFGVIDHLWNGELFLISSDWLKDLMLGVVITIGIIAGWAIILFLAKRNSALATSIN